MQPSPGMRWPVGWSLRCVATCAWWREARFGMFVHWGLYAQLGRHEWVMNRERVPRAEYEALADRITTPEWKPDFGPAEFVPTWGATARASRVLS